MGAIVRAPRRPGVVLDTGMCGRSLLGNRETPRLTTGHLPDWSASGRRGAVADDERTRGVRLRHSSWEADEQGGAIRCGAGGAKGGGQGKCGPAKHAPGAEPGERVPGAGAYTALPSRRVYIPKPDGRQRPIAVAALEDKIVQRATAAVLSAIYEEDFLGFSYGFRPGRGTHDAMDALLVGITSTKVNWILDADIRSFLNTAS